MSMKSHWLFNDRPTYNIFGIVLISYNFISDIINTINFVKHNNVVCPPSPLMGGGEGEVMEMRPRL